MNPKILAYIIIYHCALKMGKHNKKSQLDSNDSNDQSDKQTDKQSNKQEKIHESKESTMYILVNKDLKMRPGKSSSQTAHVGQQVTHKILTDTSKKYYQEYMKWYNSGSKKIVLSVTYAEIIKIIEETKDKYPCVVINDAGRTQVEPGSLTAIGFYPNDELTDLMRPYKLF